MLQLFIINSSKCNCNFIENGESESRVEVTRRGRGRGLRGATGLRGARGVRGARGGGRRTVTANTFSLSDEDRDAGWQEVTPGEVTGEQLAEKVLPFAFTVHNPGPKNIPPETKSLLQFFMLYMYLNKEPILHVYTISMTILVFAIVNLSIFTSFEFFLFSFFCSFFPSQVEMSLKVNKLR
jgi:hypothetical protein